MNLTYTLTKKSCTPYTNKDNFCTSTSYSKKLVSTIPISLPLINLTETKSYIPIAGCVLEHILTTTALTNHEKLYYLLADALSHINGKNITQGRVVSLASEDWATRLGCSRSLVFSMQKSLAKKGYFIINKDWNKIGFNKRNLITPTLPPEVFNHLNNKYPGKGGERNEYYNPATECKKAYLDRTKLFIPLNYNLLKIITSSDELTPLQKVVWLDFYTKCYKSHISSNKQSAFSCITSYEELIERYGCSKASLSKLLNSLKHNNFITKIRFFCKREHLIEDRQDKSLWQITLSMPTCYSLELMNTKDRAGLSVDIETDNLEEVSSNVSTLPLFHSQQESASTLPKHQFYSQLYSESYIDEIAEELTDLDDIVHTNNNNPVVNTDGRSEGNSTVIGIDADSGIGVNIADLTSQDTSIRIKQQIENVLTENCKNKTPYISGLPDNVSCGDPQVSKSRLLLNKDSKLNIKYLDRHLHFSEFSKIVDKPGLKLSKFYKNSLEEKEKQWHGRGKRTTKDGVSPTPNGNKTLIDYYPLSNWQVDRLNNLSGREFCINFVNQLMMKLYNKSPKKIFVSKNHMMSYMSKVLYHEKHQAPMVNHETFRFAVNLEQSEIEEKAREKYLSEIEYSLDTTRNSQLRRKIAGLFEPKLAYKLLAGGKFECLNELFIIQLPNNVTLTEKQQEFLENTVFSVYGNITINYEVVDNCFYTS